MTSTTPPYRRIADALRLRILSGELRPGDRVPSARRITREWGVAMATATKALAALRQEGLTEGRPGVGTLVTATPGRVVARGTGGRRIRVGTESGLTREQIVRVAITVADAEGMTEVSMRRIAAELDLATMSLYRHVPSKQELVLLMIDAAIGEERLPVVRPRGWRPRLEVCARLQWKVFSLHPWLAPAMSLTRPQLAPNAIAHTEWVLDAFDGSGVTLVDRMYVHIMLFSFVRGLATALEWEADAQRETGLTSDEWMETQGESFASVVTSAAMANLLRLAREEDFDFDLDQLFEFGLSRLLDGLAVFVQRANARR